ncbi:MAG TPA: hypothetical protein P5137_00975 [Candidatus Brocadiia bacterium]|nr:hypothetical protein [Candidatus Brocadiia bacterium]
MPGLLYYLPGRGAASTADLAALLPHVFEPGAPATQRGVSPGPDNGRGLLVARGEHPCEYKPAEQTWVKMRGGQAWFGWPAARPPGPEDLARPELLGLYEPCLGDGRRWRAPTAMLADGSCPLPCARRIDPETGSILKRPEPRFDGLRLLADLVADHIRHGQALTPEQEVDVCAAALAVNYRVSADEVCALGLLTDQAVQLLCWLLVDRQNWADAAAARDESEA